MIYDMLTNPNKLTNHDTLTKYVDWMYYSIHFSI